MSSARQQVLDTNLLGEVLAYLGYVKECRAALLVSRSWRTSLGRTDPWLHILRRDFPSMVAPGSFLAPQQHHQLFRRTAKELLCIRLIDSNPHIREEREVHRLEEQLQDKYITLLVRHPKLAS